MKRDVIVFLVMSVLLFSIPLFARLLKKLGWAQRTTDDEQGKVSERQKSGPASLVKQAKE